MSSNSHPLDHVPLGEAIRLIAPYGWTIHTCDMGYRCQLYTAPERGETLLADQTDSNLVAAILHALLEAKMK